MGDERREEGEDKSGELLFCGTIGRRKTSPERNFVSPTRLRTLLGVEIRFIAAGCVSSHCVAIDNTGCCYTWGNNKKGQLGHGDTVQRNMPTKVSKLARFTIVSAGAGRSHSVVVTDKGLSYAFGSNKHGQLGFGYNVNEIETSPVCCLVHDTHTAVCGGDFTVWLTSNEGESIMTAGLPKYGQLGHGSENKANTLGGAVVVKHPYVAQLRPKPIESLSDETIVKVACGTNHSVAVDKTGYVYTWGCGRNGRLVHRQQRDEFLPRLVDFFTRRNALPANAIVSAGSASSACTGTDGQLYMWGKIKNNGNDRMKPKPLNDLRGWKIRCMDSGNRHHFVGSDSSCLSWGHGQSGELGYGPDGPISSATHKEVEVLRGMHVLSVACGSAISLVVVDRTKNKEAIEKLEVYNGKAATEAFDHEENSEQDEIDDGDSDQGDKEPLSGEAKYDRLMEIYRIPQPPPPLSYWEKSLAVRGLLGLALYIPWVAAWVVVLNTTKTSHLSETLRKSFSDSVYVLAQFVMHAILIVLVLAGPFRFIQYRIVRLIIQILLALFGFACGSLFIDIWGSVVALFLSLLTIPLCKLFGVEDDMSALETFVALSVCGVFAKLGDDELGWTIVIIYVTVMLSLKDCMRLFFRWLERRAGEAQV